MKNFIRPLVLLSALALPAALASGQTLSREHSFSVNPSEAPYLVRLVVPSGSTPTNISAAGHYDATSETILWGPFEQTGSQELSFDLISDNLAAVTQGAEIVTGSGSTSGSQPSAGSGVRTYGSWAETSFPSGSSGISLSSSLDFDGDNLANVIEFFLDLDPTSTDDIWSAITLVSSGSGKELSFPQLETSAEYQLYLQVIDLENSGDVIESIELDSINNSIDELGDAYFFRLAVRRANP